MGPAIYHGIEQRLNGSLPGIVDAVAGRVQCLDCAVSAE
jgi:hypothetical protein